jgi:hypothetical protein
MTLELEDDLAGPDIPGEEFLEKVGRLQYGRMRAEEMALTELIYSQTPEPDTEHGAAERNNGPTSLLINSGDTS